MPLKLKKKINNMKHLKVFEEFDNVNIKDMMKRGYYSANVKKKKSSDKTSSRPDYPRPWVELPSQECENCNGTGIDEDNDTCGLCGGTGTKAL